MEGKNSRLINRDHKGQIQKGLTESLIKRGSPGGGVGVTLELREGKS